MLIWIRLSRLCHILHILGCLRVGGRPIVLIEKFLCEHLQFKKVILNFSSPAQVVTGVQQGILLGPPFFIIYPNDVPNRLQHSKILLYADNSNFSKSILNSR